MSEPVPVDVLGVRVEMPSNQPVVLLRDAVGSRYLPIWIGQAEASAIALAQQGVVPPRPLTHDLLVTVLATLGAQVTAVHVTELVDGTFHAELHLTTGQGAQTLSTRPSDAIAVALRTAAPVYVAADVLDEAAIQIAEEVEAGEAPVEDLDESALEQFREFLDQVNPEDFS